MMQYIVAADILSCRGHRLLPCNSVQLRSVQLGNVYFLCIRQREGGGWREGERDSLIL